MTFLLGGLCQSVGRTLRSHLRLIVFDNPRLPNPTITTYSKYTTAQIAYSVASIAAVQLTMNFTVIPFMLLEVGQSWEGWKTLYFYGIFVVLVPFALFQAGLGKTLDQVSGVAQRKKKDKAAKDVHDSHHTNPQVIDVDTVGGKAKEASKEVQQRTADNIKKDL